MMHRIGGERYHGIAGVFVFLLLGVFAVFSTLLVMVGAQAYRAIETHSEEHMAGRTLYAYVLNSIRADDSESLIEAVEVEGINTLSIRYSFDDETYIKHIYCYDGYLRELLSFSAYPFDPAAGEAIAAAESFQAEIMDGLVTVKITDAYGSEHKVQAALRTER